jgi:hypothetical protein
MNKFTMKFMLSLFLISTQLTAFSQDGKMKPDCQDTIQSLRIRYLKTIRIAEERQEKVRIQDTIIRNRNRRISIQEDSLQEKNTVISNQAETIERKNGLIWRLFAALGLEALLIISLTQ